MLRRCTKCNIEKLPSEFHRDRSTRDGLRKWCKQCAIPAAIAYHNRNKAHVSQRNRDYKALHPAKYLVWCARHRAKNTGVAFSITEQDISMPKECPILGIPLFMGGLHNPNSPSIDRIDNEKGYVSGNVHVVSYRANVLKKDATPQELRLLAKWIVVQYGA